MAETAQDKTEQPTPRKRQEAREEGNVPRSTDLTAACTLLAAVVLIYYLGQRVIHGMRTMLLLLLDGSHASNPTRPSDLGAIASFLSQVMLSSLLPLLLCLMAVVLLVTFGQVGFLLTGKPLVPKFSKLSPAKGVANMVNARAGVRLGMSLGKLALLGAVAGYIIAADMPAILRLAEMGLASAFAVASELVFDLALKLAVLLIVLAVIDFAFQRFQHEKELRMSKQEVKEEMKRMEGDPMIKQRRSRVARQLAMQRVAQQVPNADVIITNPTHFAVALKYDGGNMRAPRVIGKGADFLALRIRQIAAVHGIPIVERKPLAQALYHGVEVGQEIPPEHYAAVAEILAYVYRISGRKSA